MKLGEAISQEEYNFLMIKKCVLSSQSLRENSFGLKNQQSLKDGRQNTEAKSLKVKRKKGFNKPVINLIKIYGSP